ncbi:phage replisome organizer N-terminal domain-containing protein [Weissella paramesenteroides]|uniref:phage replisome organizer N-terminal domain-containing protein n=1 Tax=Weissella paramesenteroides TaxID=1249 RepID=UPI00255C74EA|nr:phage replisome organizer N-terminal domain-containing protein [Weissella paramesenteroides]
MANKKFFWIKLKQDFFNDPYIKLLRRMAGGDTYTIIYLEMLVKSASLTRNTDLLNCKLLQKPLHSAKCLCDGFFVRFL